ncbi:MAG: hypothetical protein QOH42_1738 [Blastocatellia bacterium]|nr:hypothetical protein [Blastocatellia bacterium]
MIRQRQSVFYLSVSKIPTAARWLRPLRAFMEATESKLIVRARAHRERSPEAIASMKEIGYDLSRHQSKSLSEIPDIEFDFVATMGCGDACPFVRAKQREDWNIPDPKAMRPEDFSAVRDLIETKVKAALALVSEARP